MKMATNVPNVGIRAQMQITMASNSAILAQGLATQVMIEQAFTGLKSGQLASICHCRGSSFPTDLKQHTPSCRYRQSVYKSRAMRRRFSFISTFFGFNVSALFDFSMGAHDLKIAPSLTLRAVVPFHAPAFALIDKLRRINWNSKEEVVLDLADTTIVQLRQLYAEGKASPSDINPFGFSILHVSSAPYLRTMDIQEINHLTRDYVVSTGNFYAFRMPYRSIFD